MTKHYFDKAYAARDTQVIRSLYDEWAGSYDEDIKAQGYATPDRAAATLAEFLDDKDAPIFDIGCGTGLSGGPKTSGLHHHRRRRCLCRHAGRGSKKRYIPQSFRARS